MRTTTKQVLVISAALAFTMGCQTREPLADRKMDKTNKIDAPVAGKGNEMNTGASGGYTSVNGLQLYYEIYPPAGRATNDGVPLILLHGGVGAVEIFSRRCTSSTPRSHRSRRIGPS